MKRKASVDSALGLIVAISLFLLILVISALIGFKALNLGKKINTCVGGKYVPPTVCDISVVKTKYKGTIYEDLVKYPNDEGRICCPILAIDQTWLQQENIKQHGLRIIAQKVEFCMENTKVKTTLNFTCSPVETGCVIEVYNVSQQNCTENVDTSHSNKRIANAQANEEFSIFISTADNLCILGKVNVGGKTYKARYFRALPDTIKPCNANP